MSGSVKVPLRQLGKNGPQIPAVGFGMMGLSVGYGSSPPDAERFAAIDAAYDLGARHFDTAQSYGDNESLLGKWLQQRPDPLATRKSLFIATKFGVSWDGGKLSTNGDPMNVRKACSESLDKLGIDQIDLYYYHRIDPNVPIEVTVRTMNQLKQEGKIKHLGLSEASPATIRRAAHVARISAVQIEYSPFALDIETNDVLKTCRELGIAVVAYSPLGRGMLSGQYKSPADFEEGDFRKLSPRFSAENFPKNLELVSTITSLAQKKSITPSQYTLAWILAQGEDFFVIPGSKKAKYIEENTKSAEVELTKEEVEELRKELKGWTSMGERYPKGMQEHLFGDSIALGQWKPPRRPSQIAREDAHGTARFVGSPPTSPTQSSFKPKSPPK